MHIDDINCKKISETEKIEFEELSTMHELEKAFENKKKIINLPDKKD